VQFDPIMPTLKAPGNQLLKLIYAKPLLNFAFEFNLRRYTKEKADGDAEYRDKVGRCRLTLSYQTPSRNRLELSVLKLKYDEPLSTFALKFNLRRYIKTGAAAAAEAAAAAAAAQAAAAARQVEERGYGGAIDVDSVDVVDGSDYRAKLGDAMRTIGDSGTAFGETADGGAQMPGRGHKGETSFRSGGSGSASFGRR